VLACTKASNVLSKLLAYASNEPEILRALMAHERWDQ